jgi:hypothetical protein
MPSLANDSSAWLRMSGVKLPSMHGSPSQSLRAASIPSSDVKSESSKTEVSTVLKSARPFIEDINAGGSKAVATRNSSGRSCSDDEDTFLVITADPSLCFSSRPNPKSLAESTTLSFLIASSTNIAPLDVKSPKQSLKGFTKLDHKLLGKVFDHVSRTPLEYVGREAIALTSASQLLLKPDHRTLTLLNHLTYKALLSRLYHTINVDIDQYPRSLSYFTNMLREENQGIKHIKRVVFDAANLIDKSKPPPGFRLLAALFLDSLPEEQLEYFRYLHVSR